MKLCRHPLSTVVAEGIEVLGFYGFPPRTTLAAVSAAHPGLAWFDLDVYHEARFARVVPQAYCHIIRNCIDNALALGPCLKTVVTAIGAEKCDAGRFASRLLAELLSCPVVETTNEQNTTRTTPLLCEARGPLRQRVVRIMDSIVEPLGAEECTAAEQAQVQATCGFWGTPPHPIEVLDLFPETTAIYGWTRCVELARPADLDLELYVPADLPIVFFSQGFCHKALIARTLAERHRGMHVDVHDTLGAATTAKIEAFIRLSGGAR